MKTILKWTSVVMLVFSTAACSTFNAIQKSSLISYQTIDKEMDKRAGDTAIGVTSGFGTEMSAYADAFIAGLLNNLSGAFLPANIKGQQIPEQKSSSKNEAIKRGNIYTVSGIGSGLTGGRTHDLLKGKFSTNLGLDISLGKGNFFLYPSADFLAFRYDQQIPDISYSYGAQKSRATYSTFTLSLGYRKSIGNFSIYQFAGLGGGLVKEPRMSVDVVNQQTVLISRKSYTSAVKGGIGVDYRMGHFVLFTEGSHLHNLKSLQQRKVLVFPVYIGLKSNISSLFKSEKLK